MLVKGTVRGHGPKKQRITLPRLVLQAAHRVTSQRSMVLHTLSADSTLTTLQSLTTCQSIQKCPPAVVKIQHTEMCKSLQSEESLEAKLKAQRTPTDWQQVSQSEFLAQLSCQLHRYTWIIRP